MYVKWVNHVAMWEKYPTQSIFHEYTIILKYLILIGEAAAGERSMRCFPLCELIKEEFCGSSTFAAVCTRCCLHRKQSEAIRVEIIVSVCEYDTLARLHKFKLHNLFSMHEKILITLVASSQLCCLWRTISQVLVFFVWHVNCEVVSKL